jgi:hypothetical protein
MLALIPALVLAAAMVADGYVEVLGNHRDVTGLLIQTPLAQQIIQGRLAVSRAGSENRILTGTGAINVKAGVIGTAGGAANDTALLTAVLLKNAAAVTLTVTGFQDEAGTAQSLLLTGSTAADTIYEFHGLPNTKAVMTLTCSVADKCLVGVQPY